MKSSHTCLPDIQWIARKATEDPNVVFQRLAHHLDEELLKEAFRRLRKNAAPGIDGQTAAEYAEGVSANLRDVHERLRTQTYRATPMKRTWIPKDDGSQRPIGTLILEDKIVQKAVAMLLEEVFEQEFYDFSCGFRPGRSPHKALHAVRELIQRVNIGWILDMDIRQFFDSVDREILFDLLHRRVHDGGIDRLLGKWFNVGILDGDQLSYNDLGTPQGGGISPMIANIYLHYVLDDWFVKEVQPRLKGRCVLVRFADEAIMGFEYEEDARRVAEVLPKRFHKYGVHVHPDKTRLVRFIRPARGARKDRTNETFDFLGCTQYLGKSRQGYWVVKRRTIRKRLRRAISRLAEWCQFNRHMSVKEQWKKLSQKLRGYYQYDGIRGNYDSIYWVYYLLRFSWRRW
jgi:RNA-directed DNA polymerase